MTSPLTDTTTVMVRPARLEDAEAIRAIYNPYAEGTTVTFDVRGRSLEEQREWLVAHLGIYPVVVAERGDDVVGFASLSPWRDRAAYRTSVEDSVYVRPDGYRRGVGRHLLDAVLTAGRDHGFHTVLARIVGGHEASIQLHRQLGFAIVGTEREVGRKFQRWLDVVVMQKMLAEDAPPQP